MTIQKMYEGVAEGIFKLKEIGYKFDVDLTEKEPFFIEKMEEVNVDFGGLSEGVSVIFMKHSIEAFIFNILNNNGNINQIKEFIDLNNKKLWKN